MREQKRIVVMKTFDCSAIYGVVFGKYSKTNTGLIKSFLSQYVEPCNQRNVIHAPDNPAAF